ncbi:translation initiation factor IF-2 [Phenylobacterium sp.]|jgi:translation initiation factor IF-2|uniref:translation initiation factor IF-2 n=1 Tax=Phenylobacterium sp. TaxID=1871053 RepID=UPI002F3FEA5C
MSDDNNNGRPSVPGGRTPLTLKPRGAVSVSAGTVKQSFSHGRSKTVVVETKRARTHAAPSGNLAAPSSAEKRVFDPRPQGQSPRPSRGADASGLSSEELQARQRAIELARERQDAERAAAEGRAHREAEAAVQAERAAAPVAEAPAEAPAEPPPPEAAAAPVVQPVAEAPAAPAPRPPSETPRPPEAPRMVETPRTAAAPTGSQTRTYQPSADRRDDRPTTTTYRPDRERPAPRFDTSAFGQRAPRADGPRPPRDDRAPPRSDRPQGDRPQGDRPQGDRPRPGGDTVRFSALAPRPAPRDSARPGGPRPPRPGAGAAPPATPEVQRATRQAPRPGAANLDRRPDEDDDGARRGKTPTAPNKAISRAKNAPQRREGRLTIQAVAGDDEDAVERMRSLASVRRAREREREKRKGGGQEAARTAREVIIPDVITVGELGNRMATRGVDIIKFLMRQGVMLKINDVIDNDTAELVATEFGHTVRRVSEADVEEGFIGAEDVDDHLEPRPPVVTVMGHVDHGKTSLLDALRATDVAAGEHGGITQHIGAYQVRLPDGQRVTFLDTPGHAAFSAMRARGADVTDIVVLVVAADDGVMPQTIEAIHHAKASGAPIIVAINKIDKPDADPTRVINELLQHEIVVESLGGDTQAIQVSATQKMGLEDLIEAILLQAEVLDLRANPDRTADGVVIEAKLDRGRGAVSTVLVKRGTLKRGDIVVAGANFGRVRALFNERDEQVDSAGPSEPVEILGLDGTPDPGEPFAVVENEARARELTAYRVRVKRERAGSPIAAGVSLADMMAKLQDKRVSELPVVIKADVQGSAEAIVGSLDKLATDEVRARIILSGAGAISESDVMLAKGANSPVLGFNVRASKQARELADREGVEIRYYAVIYDLIDDIKGVLSGMLAPIQRETFIGNAEVLQVFDITKVGKVAGCRVTEGTVRKGARVRIVRQDVVVLELGVLQTLKRFKDEVNEVTAGQECGMAFQGFQDIKEGDTIECFTLEEVKRSL